MYLLGTPGSDAGAGSRGVLHPGPTLSIDPDLGNVRSARRFVAEQCRASGVDGAVSDSAVLLTSEVVTNAFLHGRSEARVRVSIEPTRVVVLVGDDDSRQPVPVVADEQAFGGRGVAIVDRMASRWGVQDEGLGKTVWFCLDRD